eukprot:13824104-Heterocapsa_arctica.AAC.1
MDGDAMSSAGPTMTEMMNFMKTGFASIHGTLKEVTSRLDGLEVIKGDALQVKEDVSTLNKR